MPALEAAAIAAFGKVVASTLPKVISKIEEVLKKRAGLEDHVDTLKFHLHAIQSVITENRKIIRSQSSTSQQLRNWTVELRCFAYDMEDYIEGYGANTITGAKLYDKITELKKSVVDLIGLWQQLATLQGELNQISHDGGASSSYSTSNNPTSPNPQRQLDPALLLADLTGEEQLGELLDLHATKLKVILVSVVGFGGTGKTNLCRQVYDRAVSVHNNGKDHFSRSAFVSAAGKDKNEVLGEIILRFLELESEEQGYDENANVFTRFIKNQLTNLITPLRINGRLLNGQEISQDGNKGIANASIDVGNQVQQYISKLAQRLEDKRYCIGVDDVGSEELGKFLISLFPENNMGSRIIIGMAVVGSKADVSVNRFRTEVVAGEVRQQQQHRFQILNSSSATSLLMLMTCEGGVPLSLVSISEVPKGPFNADNVDEAWGEFRAEEAARLKQDMDLLLPHSYDRLQHIQSVNNRRVHGYIPDIQACLLYFAIFPPGNHVKRGSLIRRWLAEGIELGSSSIDEASKNLQALIDRNFVWPLLHVTMSQGQHVKACQPPQEMLRFIADMSEEEYFIMMSCARAHTTTLNDIRRLSLHPAVVVRSSGARRNPTNGTDYLPQRLRTLAVSRRASVDRIVGCKRLRVLDLEEYSGLQARELEKICNNLNLLKYLSLQADGIKKVPHSISNLKWLETLDMGEKGDSVQVPMEVLELQHLKHLLGKFELEPHNKYGIPNRLIPVSQKIENNNLQRLAGFLTSKGEGFPPRMARMKNLWKVKIWFKSDADAKSLKAYLPDAITNFLRDGTIDRTLSLCFEDGCPSPGKLLDCQAEALAEECRRELYSLKLCGKNLSKIPGNFVAKLTGIKKLRLSGWATIKLDATFLDELSKMKDLEYLKLDAVKIEGTCDTTQAGNSQEKVVIDTTHVKKVEHMSIVASSRLPVIEIKPGALQNLVSLHLISEDIRPSASVICKAPGQADAHLAKLKEVALNASVDSETKKDWHKAAREHNNCPRILFIEHPRPRR